MNIAIFGGTFDPVHCGHLSAARAARDCFELDRIHFVPSGRPPHRTTDRLTPFDHRYAMVTLACAGEPAFVPSLAEAPAPRVVNYTIRTVRRFRQELAKDDRLFLIIGADAFLEFRSWRQWRLLLDRVNLLIVSRPGFPLARVEKVFPPELILRTNTADCPAGAGNPAVCVREFHMRKTTARVLAGVWEPVSATEVRRRARQGRSLAGLVPASVAEYIRKHRLYT